LRRIRFPIDAGRKRKAAQDEKNTEKINKKPGAEQRAHANLFVSKRMQQIVVVV
jgi:hypothetical protein